MAAAHTDVCLYAALGEAFIRLRGGRCATLMAEAVTIDGATPLFNSGSSGSAACVRLILQLSACIHTTYLLASPIHEAAKKEADVQIGCGQDSPLHSAVREEQVSVVDLLLDFGADLCFRNDEEKAPLQLSKPSSSVRAALLNRGPCSLSQLCRSRIRQSLRRSRLHRSSSLFLLHSIKAFLLYR